jgi:hypothetical protein
MSLWPIVILVCLALFAFVIVFALCRKDSVCAAVWFRPFGFYLAARGNGIKQKPDVPRDLS